MIHHCQSVSETGFVAMRMTFAQGVGVMHASLAGMNGNPVFEAFEKGLRYAEVLYVTVRVVLKPVVWRCFSRS